MTIACDLSFSKWSSFLGWPAAITFETQKNKEIGHVLNNCCFVNLHRAVGNEDWSEPG